MYATSSSKFEPWSYQIREAIGQVCFIELIIEL
jgi:hypothetical protein